MKKNVILFGTLSGAIVTLTMVIGTAICYNNTDFQDSMVLGFTAMFVAFSFIFVGIKNFRDKKNGGVITFKQAFLGGVYMSLIASTMYVVVWMIEYYFFIPDFMDKYAAHMIKMAEQGGASAEEMKSTMEQIDSYNALYKTPVGVFFITYTEVLPIALVFALLSALILKKKPKPELQAGN